MQGALLQQPTPAGASSPTRRPRGAISAHGISLRDDQLAALDAVASARPGKGRNRSQVLREIVDHWMRMGGGTVPENHAGLPARTGADKARQRLLRIAQVAIATVAAIDRAKGSPS